MAKKRLGKRTRNVWILKRRHDDGTYYDGFWTWLSENWHIYDGVVRRARQARDVGDHDTRWSVDAICQVIRWDTMLGDRSQSTLKINDHCTSGLARIIMARESDLEGYFKTRTPPAKDQAVKLDGSSYGGDE